MKVSIKLDDTDRRILIELSKSSEKVSTRELAKKLDIPDRTVRYRLKKLKEKGLLSDTRLQTYERKIGLGEKLLLLQINPQKKDLLINVLDNLDSVYYYSPMFGRYDGFQVYIVYPLVTPQVVQEIIDELVDHELVLDVFPFDLVDYVRKGPEVLPLMPESDWDWSVWDKEIQRIMKKGCKADVGLEEFPKTESVDYRDIQIMKHMIENPSATFKEITEALAQKDSKLSLTQVHKRVQRLKDAKIIRGIWPSFTPFKDTLFLLTFFKSKTHAKEILCAFHKLPFEMTFVMQSTTQYEVFVNLPCTEYKSFLKVTSQFRKHCEEFFIQIVLMGKSKGYSHFLTFFNRENETWEMPIGELLEKIRDIVSSS